jgi:hypothetical protein
MTASPNPTENPDLTQSILAVELTLVLGFLNDVEPLLLPLTHPLLFQTRSV